MSIPVESRFLASLENEMNVKLPEGQQAGIAVYGRNDPIRLFAWMIGNTYDIRLGSKVITVNKESLEKFVQRHNDDPNMKEGKSVVEKFQNFLNNNEVAKKAAAEKLNGPAKAKFRVEFSDVFTGPARVYADAIKALKSLPSDISKGFKGAATVLKRDAERFIKDAGESKPIKRLEEDLNNIKTHAEDIRKNVAANPAVKKTQAALQNFEKAVRNMLAPTKEPTKDDDEQVTFSRKEAATMAAKKGAERVEKFKEKGYDVTAKRYDAKVAPKHEVSPAQLFDAAEKELIPFDRYDTVVRTVKDEKTLRDSLGAVLGRFSPDNKKLNLLIAANVRKMDPQQFKKHVAEFITLIEKGYKQISTTPGQVQSPGSVSEKIAQLIQHLKDATK